MPSYKTHDPKGWCGDPSRGAALGRGRDVEDGPPEGRLTLRKIVLDSGGYDANGTYFGHGQPLFWYADDGGNVDAVFRSIGNSNALAAVQDKFPGVKIVTGPALQPPCMGPEWEVCTNDAQEHSEYCEEHEYLEGEGNSLMTGVGSS